MKLILTSSGLANEDIITTLEAMVDKPRQEINAIVINEAIKAEVGNMRWFTDELQRLTSIVGGNIEFVDLQAHNMQYVEDRIDHANMIFCFGGNADYLANTFVRTGFDKLLPKILSHKVWVGSSAGSCVLCHKEAEETQNTIYQEKRETDHFMEYVPIIFLPHLHSSTTFGKSEVERASQLTGLPAYALSDNAALKIVDNQPPIMLGPDYIIADVKSR